MYYEKQSGRGRKYLIYALHLVKQSVIRGRMCAMYYLGTKYIIYHIKKKGAFKAPNPQRKVQVPWLERCLKSD